MQARAEWVMKLWVPLIIGAISIACILIEVRVGIQYIAGDLLDLSWAREAPSCNRILNSAQPGGA